LTRDGGFILRGGNKRWSRLRDQDHSKVVQIKQSSFIRRFGASAERLPIALRQSISQLRVDGQLVALSRSVRREAQLGTAAVISLQAHRERIEQLKCTFNLGSHTYSGGPGFCWTCDYRIERLNDDGTLWDLLGTDEETGEFQSMGSHSGFSISQEEWGAMGATFPVEEAEDDYEELEDEVDDEVVGID
jgi:hypothetical protein